MKMIFNKMTVAIISLVVFFAAGAALAMEVNRPAVNNAAGVTGSAEAAKEKATNAADKLYCDKIIGLFSKIDQRISGFSANLQKRRGEVADKMDDARQKRDETLKNVRSRWTENRQEQFSSLASKAQTDSQKTAVNKFKNEVTAAIAVRQKAVDAAIRTYRAGVDKAIKDRKAEVDALKLSYRNSMKAAIDKAKADCNSSADAKAARDNLQASLKTIQEKFNSDRQAMERTRTQTLEQLRTARRQAVEKAVSDFKATMERLRTELKAAFGETLNSSDSNAASTTPQ